MRFLLLLSYVVISSCATVDPRFDSLIGSAATNPKKDAIVGMWSHKHVMGPGTRNETCLFQTNGGAICRYTFVEHANGASSVFQDNGTWVYNGAGLWTLKKPGTDMQLRMSNGILLGIEGPNRYVFDPVN